MHSYIDMPGIVCTLHYGWLPQRMAQSNQGWDKTSETEIKRAMKAGTRTNCVLGLSEL